MFVAQVPAYCAFVSDSQVVEAITEVLGIDEDYGSYFVNSIPRFEFAEFAGVDKDTVIDCIRDRQIIELYGLEGIIPYNHRHAWRIDIS